MPEQSALHWGFPLFAIQEQIHDSQSHTQPETFRQDRELGNFICPAIEPTRMTLEIDHDCPHCGASTFYRSASTLLALGEKVKWQCVDCDYGFVRIGDTVDTASAEA